MAKKNKTEGGKNKTIKRKAEGCKNKTEGGKNKAIKNMTEGGKRKTSKRKLSAGASDWNKLVMKTFHKMRATDKTAKLRDAMKEAARLKKKGDI